ncbi:DNA mismatch repair protein [Caballeronia udeis]|uniref:DNA mismatch repair protein n=1 Tax=Caballeronia udeis TaxID=1232866 RepID=A0A158F7D7_9BURK|nr:ATP-binding protein [Caballeronia udeis]SAL15563.1 DNA mismatch repair protein [Caballeronia udeis]
MASNESQTLLRKTVGESGDVPLIDEREELAAWLGEKTNEGQVVRTRLKTSDRVIARVTDGIYRQPSSALRELISNAWDADANQVTVLTDAPRFSRIYVRDDGAGMSYETLSRLVHSIGGSAKRREEGQKLGVSSEDDPDRTPGGRLLIGKIGIGLFSVSQLARRFRIVTKVRGRDYRLIAEVRIRAYSEDGEDDAARDDDDNYVSGDVLISREYSSDRDAHGTDIILDEVKPRVRDMLRSADRWRALDEKAAAEKAGDFETAANIRVEEPKYHTGWIERLSQDKDQPAVLSRPPKLPWSPDAPADVRMGLLIDAVEHESRSTERPDLAKTLDTYLETLWTLALSVPVGYVDKHPFDLTADSGIGLYWISNEPRGQATELTLSDSQTVRDAVREQVAGHPELEDGKIAKAGDFRVNIDGVELKRPIRFKFVKTATRGFGKPMLFVGRFSPNLQKVDPSLRGGGFGLEGYVFWNGMVVPKENNGVLTRIRGTAGALFDPTFMKYQVSEQTRLRQITSELFITRGLDAALNIDRESFNFSHPHVQFVAIWLHRAIRQLTNKHKDLSKRARTEKLEQTAVAVRDSVTQHSEAVWSSRHVSDPAPEIAIATTRKEAEAARADGYMALARTDLPSLSVALPSSERTERDVKAQALMRVLAAYDVLDDRSYDEQQALIDAILKIFFASPGK